MPASGVAPRPLIASGPCFVERKASPDVGWGVAGGGRLVSLPWLVDAELSLCSSDPDSSDHDRPLGGLPRGHSRRIHRSGPWTEEARTLKFTGSRKSAIYKEHI